MSGRQAGIQSPRNCDPSVRQAIMQLASVVFGPESNPEFGSVTLNSLTADRLLYGDSDKALASVADLTSWIAGTADQISVTDDSDGTVTLATPQDIAVDSDVEFQSLLIDQNTDAIGLEIDSGATTLTNYGLKCVTGAGAGAALFSYGAVANGSFYCGLPNNGGYSGNFVFARDLAAASTDSAIVYIHQDNAGDDQPCLELQQDGTGYALVVNGSSYITGDTIYGFDIVIPDGGSIRSDVAERKSHMGQAIFIKCNIHGTGMGPESIRNGCPEFQIWIGVIDDDGLLPVFAAIC